MEDKAKIERCKYSHPHFKNNSKRCKACKTEGFEYPEEYCCIGVSDDEINEDRNGDLGCNLHWKTINHLICKENEIPQEPWCMPKGTE